VSANASAEDWAAAALGHRFRDPALLAEALTHGSVGQPDYQRLEFLGDRVLALATAERLYQGGEDLAAMARRLAALVDRARCAAVARALGAAPHIRVDRGARAAGVHSQDNVLADVCEALIGALYLDGGWAAASAFIARAWAGQAEAGDAAGHPKNRLQEWAAARGFKLPAYEVVAREGPDHAPRFRVLLSVTGQQPVEAMGTSKAEAERAAAEALLERLGL
jgi:ribonuclease-3